jgi:hypothetical protein
MKSRMARRDCGRNMNTGELSIEFYSENLGKEHLEETRILRI